MTKKEFICQYILEMAKHPDSDMTYIVHMAINTWEAIEKECEGDVIEKATYVERKENKKSALEYLQESKASPSLINILYKGLSKRGKDLGKMSILDLKRDFNESKDIDIGGRKISNYFKFNLMGPKRMQEINSILKEITPTSTSPDTTAPSPSKERQS